jgi:ABC-type uncharacterized transport system substrate-binding protein
MPTATAASAPWRSPRSRRLRFPASSNSTISPNLWVDGKAFKSFDATDLMVTHKGDSVSYDMQITLTKPLDPRRVKVEAAIFDDTYYVEVGLHSPGPVRFKGIPEGSCKYSVKEDDSRAYYYETVYPEVITLSC